MKLAIRLCLGIIACLALTLMVVSTARSENASSGSTADQAAIAAAAGSESAATPSMENKTPAQVAKAMEGCRSMGMKMEPMEEREMGEMGMMGMPMHQHMGMMHMIAHNPKLAGRMLEMRADMMRAVADVMTKYGKEMESGEWQAMQQTSSAAE